jgi:hypothetical protein
MFTEHHPLMKELLSTEYEKIRLNRSGASEAYIIYIYTDGQMIFQRRLDFFVIGGFKYANMLTSRDRFSSPAH